MKKLFYIKTALVSVMAMAMFSSCLKDKAREIVLSNGSPIVDFALTAFGTGATLNTATLSAASTTNSLNATISIGAPHDYTTPTSVTVIVDAANMTATYGTTYTLLPASVYTVSSLTASIIPGISQRIEAATPIVGAPATYTISLGVISFVVNTAAFQALDQTKTYMLPLTITQANVSGNGAVVDQFNHLNYKIAIK